MVEGKAVEFKREYMDDIKYAVIAFANTEGGKLYIGINDDGTACGVDHADDTMLRLTNMIRDIVRPDVTMFTDCSVEKMEGKDVVVLTVQRGTARPYYLLSKGVCPEGVYVRQGASSVPASETAILNMIRETNGDCYKNPHEIINKWNELEAIVRELTPEESTLSFSAMMRNLKETKLVSDDDIMVIENLRKIRNQLVHDSPSKISLSQTELRKALLIADDVIEKTKKYCK